MREFNAIDDRGGHLDLLLATSEIGIWELDVATGDARRNARHDQIFGHNELLDSWSADVFLTYVFEEDRKRIGALLSTSVTDSEPWAFETKIKRADGAERWISAKGVPKFAEDGTMLKLIGHVIDITETKQTEDRLKLLTQELNHRVSNTFTIMNSMIRHAAKKTNTVDEFADTLMTRLAALSRSNRVLTAQESERSSLDEILKMEFEAFAGWRQRIYVEGNTHYWFSGEASEALSLIFHELLTNAVKYGALSVSSGKIVLSIRSGAGAQVLINWRESDGPLVAKDRQTGIGSSISQNAMREEGTVKLDFAAHGLVCDITVHDSFQREMPNVNDTQPAEPSANQHSYNPDTALNGRRILVVEDDPIIGLDIAGILASRGAIVIGPHTTNVTALMALGENPDVALLDVNLGRETTDEVALQLNELSVPFIVLSGQIDSSDLGSEFASGTVVPKPFSETQLVKTISDILSR